MTFFILFSVTLLTGCGSFSEENSEKICEKKEKVDTLLKEHCSPDPFAPCHEDALTNEKRKTL